MATSGQTAGDTAGPEHSPGTQQTGRSGASARISLVVSDMDGTLLTPQKQVTPRALAATRALRAAGVPLCLVSSRPPGGMEMYFDQLGMDTPYGALNGGTIFNADRTIRSSLVLNPHDTREALHILRTRSLEAWLFKGHGWLVDNRQGEYVQAESNAVRMMPTVVPDLAAHAHDVGKITASSTDFEAIRRQEVELGRLLAGRASVARCSRWFLDITPPQATKGHAVRHLAALYGIGVENVACIGDMVNDVPMLSIAGLAIAMGQALPDVRATAHYTTAANTEEGWARAMEELVLPRCVPPPMRPPAPPPHAGQD
ncbi:MAG: Cof-type HAD-IIB family hydrolase [Acetobacter sp.]|uniref:HAD family hydrolase n=4 Tax=Acetobacter sp. TaxID=440 RepID=UPI0039EC86B1